LQKTYARALAATKQELRALESAVKGLKAGNDPVVAIKTLRAAAPAAGATRRVGVGGRRRPGVQHDVK
jgi:hypothetical protein